MLSVRETTRVAVMDRESMGPSGFTRQTQAYRYIRAHPGCLVGELCMELQVDLPKVRTALRALWKDGHITSSDGGRIDPKNRMASLNRLVFHSPDLRDEYVGEAISAGMPKHKAVTIADWAVADAAERGMPHDWAQYNG